MAKAKAAGSANKVSFGKKTTGKAKKGYGPKEQKPKRYRGQGRQGGLNNVYTKSFTSIGKGLYENSTKDRENPQYIFYTIS